MKPSSHLLNPANHALVLIDNLIVPLTAHYDDLEKNFTNDALELAAGLINPREIRSDRLVTNQSYTTDAGIVQNVTILLKSYTSLNYEEIKITVADGWVYLTGVVEWDFVQEPLVNSINQLEGVVGVNLRLFAFKRNYRAEGQIWATI